MEKVIISLIANMSYPICAVDTDNKFIFVNKMYAKITGKTEDELIGSRKEDVFDKFTCEQLNECYRTAMETGEITFLNIFTNEGYKDCTIVPVKDMSGEITALLGIIGVEKEIIGINKQQKELDFQKNLTRAIIEILPGIVFCKNIKGEYIYANRECEKFYEERGIYGVIGKTEDELNYDDKQVEWFENVDRYVLEKGETCCNEIVYENNDGKATYREVVKLPLMDSYGNVYGIVGRSLDVTERRIYENNLKYLSYTDTLTQAKNRTYFEHMDRKYSREGKFPVGIIMGDSNGLKLVNDTFGHSEGDNLLIETANAIKRAVEGIGEVFRFGGDEFVVLIPKATMELCDKVIASINEECRKFRNEIFLLSISLGASLKANKDVDIYDALKVAEDKVYKQKLIRGNSFNKSVLDSLNPSLFIKSEENAVHNKRVTKNALKLAEKLNMSDSECGEVKLSAELHDIGFIGVSEEILNKRRSLNHEEYEEMKTHTEKGYRIVKAISNLKDVADNVLHHHERWDGNGYPIGLKGEEIPIISRIISICDAFDAITHTRIYREDKMTTEEALAEIKRCSGTQFDPQLVDLFVEMIKQEKALI